ncbi:hypothetical protein [Methylophilus sp. 5]|uniref:hypothetical protein n=1 Tax=Methylophilus sp. 5 TaxID=1112274 RepID=UPI00048ED972|nr:hypothetical protein [Methylophilus sp. 5]
MKKSKPAHTATSALSLIAITAGTVSAALVIMFMGFFMTVVSIGSTTQAEMHTAENTSNALVAGHVLVANAAISQAARAGKSAHPAEKGHFMDALLRDDMHSSAATAAGGQPQSAAKVTRIYANPLSMPFVPAKSRVTKV